MMLLNKTHLLKKINKKIIDHVKSEIGTDLYKEEIKDLQKEVDDLKNSINKKNILITRMNKRIATVEKDVSVITKDLVAAITILNEIYFFLEKLSNNNKNIDYH